MFIDLWFPTEFGMAGSTFLRRVTIVFMVRFIGSVENLQVTILAVKRQIVLIIHMAINTQNRFVKAN